MTPRFCAAIAAAMLSGALVPGLRAAEPDNNVEWNGLSHIDWLDRRPLCPVGGEAFDVLFQVYRDDITSARVYVDDGSPQWVTAELAGRRGPYDVWTD